MIIHLNPILGKEIAYLKFDYLNPKFENKERFEELFFSINGKIYRPDNNIHEIATNEKGFDEFIFGEKGKFINKTFLTKFKKNKTYIIQYNICNNTYILFAEKNSKRGEVKFVNKSKEQIIGEIGYLIQEKIEVNNESKFHFALESAMCYFKVCPIKIYKSNYNDDIDYTNEELENLILGEFFYHFLHEEKIVIEYRERGNIEIKIES